MKSYAQLFSISALIFVSAISQGSTSTVTKCVQITCSKTSYTVSMTGTTEADIAQQIKQKYPNCSFVYVDKSKCKK